MTESLVRISWGGTSKAPVLRSTHLQNNKNLFIIRRFEWSEDPPVSVDTREDEEQSWTFSPSGAESAQPEYDGSLVFLDNLNTASYSVTPGQRKLSPSLFSLSSSEIREKWLQCCSHLDTAPYWDGEGEEHQDVGGEGDEGGADSVLSILVLRGPVLGLEILAWLEVSLHASNWIPLCHLYL